jgi:hypothetical protein
MLVSIPTILIVGKGRSGTTWIGSVFNTHPGFLYKYEPFLAAKAGPWRDWLGGIDHGEPDQRRQEFFRLCSTCLHDVDLPPFPPKHFRRKGAGILHFLHLAGKRLPAMRRLYESIGRPRMDQVEAVLIKDVNFPNEKLTRLCEVLEPYLLCVVRNPFANVASYLQGIEEGLMQRPGAADVARVRGVLQSPGFETVAPYAGGLETMSREAFEALRWRIQVEPLAAIARAHTKARLVVYDDLCRDPVGGMRDLFAFLGREMPAATAAFLDKTVKGDDRAARGRKAYYSVYRDPAESLSKWQRQLDGRQRAEMAAVLRESPLMTLWPELADELAPVAGASEPQGVETRPGPA